MPVPMPERDHFDELKHASYIWYVLGVSKELLKLEFELEDGETVARAVQRVQQERVH